MKKLLLVVSMLLAPLAAWAQENEDVLLLPAVQVRLGDGSVRSFGPNDGQMRPLENGATAWRLDGFSFGDGSVLVDPITVVYKTDPFVNWAISVTSLQAAPVSFSFLFTVPYVGGPYDELVSNLSATLSSEGTGAAMALTSIAHDSLLDSNVIVSLATALPDCAGTSSPLDCGSTSGQASVASFASGTFSSRVEFTLTPRTSATLLGGTTLQTAVVPEPQTYVLLLAGLLGVVAMARRRRAAH